MGRSPTNSLVDHLLGGLQYSGDEGSNVDEEDDGTKKTTNKQDLNPTFYRIKRIRSRDVHVTFCLLHR